MHRYRYRKRYALTYTHMSLYMCMFSPRCRARVGDWGAEGNAAQYQPYCAASSSSSHRPTLRSCSSLGLARGCESGTVPQKRRRLWPLHHCRAVLEGASGRRGVPQGGCRRGSHCTCPAMPLGPDCLKRAWSPQRGAGGMRPR